jgi:hypothetical protein
VESQSLSGQSGSTPPSIVARSDNPPAALGAFIAQELEHWGFEVIPAVTDTSTLFAKSFKDGGTLRIEIRGPFR